MPSVITFDLFSALTDSRAGGSRVFGAWAASRSWSATGEQVYDTWDRLNKAAQAATTAWVPYAALAEQALDRAYGELELDGDVATDVAVLLESQADWPLWPDVAAGLRRISAGRRVGILSNVDDALVVRTRAAALFAPELLLTSERLGVYKPDPRIYERARDACGGGLVHVATSARDVRGSLEAGIDVVRLRRSGHRLDPDGPTPTHEVSDLDELADVLGC
ncbi:HAD family hydrolase [Nocardioides mesophilus]|uniref:Haloacid dehalogenase n=1 Tax=Nocardioides mesophilus TaxID=433659 RepID=A0A7G9RD76_9ACTN|nr:HAD family hydrolase [Nocardioides mesophilus]QNN53551.1 haloacid dehalogenase [Nocardioides mesophilus]